MAFTYLEIPDTRVTVGSPMEQNIFDDLYEQSLAGIDHPFVLTFPDLSTTDAAYGATKHTFYFEMPDEPRQLRLILAIYTDAGSLGSVKIIPWTTGADEIELTTTATSTEEKDYVFPLSTVEDRKDQEVVLDIHMKVAGGDTVRAEMIKGPVSAWEQDGATR